MSDTSGCRFSRRAALALAAAAGALAIAGAGTTVASAAMNPPRHAKIISSQTSGLAARVQVPGTTVTLAPGGYSSGTATCPPNTEVFGGGESNSSGSGALVLTDSWPLSNTSWLVYVKNTGSVSGTFTPYAVCR